jgi:DnaK suppressor protein
LTRREKTVNYDTLIVLHSPFFSEERSLSMATAKSPKKKSGPAKKSVLTTKKKKTEKRPEKKQIKKKVLKKKEEPMMKAVKPPQNMVSAKSREEVEGFRKALMDMRQKLLAGISESPVPEALVTQSDIGDIIDQAGDERDRELSLLLSGRDKEKLLAINEALEKLNEGDYGVCEECGEKIGPGRLKVIPLAKLCVSCQAKFEKEVSLLRKADEDLTYRGLAYSSGADEEEG